MLSVKKYIKFSLLKFTLLQALIPPVFFFAFNILVGFEIPMIVLLGFSLISAIGFALAGATMAALVLDSVMINDEIRNTSQIIGRGSVHLSKAKRSLELSPMFIALKDKENKAIVRIPRPFWADDPLLIKEILDKVKIIQRKTKKLKWTVRALGF